MSNLVSAAACEQGCIYPQLQRAGKKGTHHPDLRRLEWRPDICSKACPNPPALCCILPPFHMPLHTHNPAAWYGTEPHRPFKGGVRSHKGGVRSHKGGLVGGADGGARRRALAVALHLLRKVVPVLDALAEGHACAEGHA